MSLTGAARFRKVYCECCERQREPLAHVVDGKLVIADRRHGREHSVILDAADLASLGLGVELEAEKA